MKTKTLRLLFAILCLSALFMTACKDSSSPVAPPSVIDTVKTKTPVLISIDPTFALIGDAILIKGKYFDSTQGTSYVLFKGGKATIYTSWNDTLIIVKVPLLAETGDVTVVIGSKSSNAKPFKLGTVAGPPTIYTTDPTNAKVGDTISVIGANFGNQRDTNYLVFNTTKCMDSDYISWSDGLILVKVPVSAKTGKITIYVGINKAESFSFTVDTIIPPKIPNINSITPQKGIVGTEVTISGVNFGFPRNTNTVEFNGTVALDDDYLRWEDNEIIVKVPAGATSGPIKVHNKNLYSNTVNFEVTTQDEKPPVINSFDKSSALPGELITIIGTNFGITQGTGYVEFNGVQASEYTLWSDTQIKVKVPASATSGQVFVYNTKAVKSNGSYFTVTTKKWLLTMISIPAGSFDMGSKNDPNVDVNPVHRVTISKPFYMSAHEITQEKWKKIFMGSDPSKFKGNPTYPVEQITWLRAVEWCNALSDYEGLAKCYTISGEDVTCDFTKNGFRLPTEAEWEYACRAGTTGDYNVNSSDVDSYAWTRQNSNDETHDVGQKESNAWTLFDMHGNVYEWCWDWYEEYSASAQTDPLGPATTTGTRVIRGGSSFDLPKDATSWVRADRAPTFVDMRIGFRVVRNK